MNRSGVRVRVADAVLAFVLGFVGVVGTFGAGQIAGNNHPVDGWALALVLISALVLVVRQSWPVAVLAAVAPASAVYLIIGYPYGPILFSFFVAVYTVARHLPLRPASIASAGAMVMIAPHMLFRDSPLGVFGVVPASAWVVVPFAIGVTVRLTREAAARAQAELIRRHADEERLRVAQEVHDVVGHGLSAINMQAEIALHLLPSKPEQAELALTAISRSSKEALAELRAALAVVRRTGADEESRSPTPGLARLDDLVARLSGTGVPVHVKITGRRRDLPAAVDLTAYRVVQESLTNVLRHAGQATATVRLDYREDAVSVQVTDTGRGAPSSLPRADGGGVDGAGGHGVAGMRDRVTALGGTFQAGPADGGGFRVSADLPLHGGAA